MSNKDTGSESQSVFPSISKLEEALRQILGIEFGKLSFTQTEFEVSTKMPHGQILRKTTITEIVRDGIITKHFEKKGVNYVV